MPFYVSVGPRGVLFRVGTLLTRVLGSVAYWWACRKRSLLAPPLAAQEALTEA
jgi:hypothetical protein